MELSDEPGMASDDAHGTQDRRALGRATQPVTMRAALPVLDSASRSPDPDVCPFFRRQVDGTLYAPLNSPDEENVCAAIGVPKPQSARQQELVCLKAAHADCPRYLRGALAFPEPPRPRRAAAVPRATLAALLILILSAGISFGFVVQRGGIAMPMVDPAPSDGVAVVATPTARPTGEPSGTPTPESSAPVATGSAEATPTADAASPSPSPEPTPTPAPVATPTPAPTATATPEPTDEPAVTPSSAASPSADPGASASTEPASTPTLPPTPSPEPTPDPTVAPTVVPTATPKPERTPKPTPKPTRKPTSDRFRLLSECPDRNNCWIYTVRSGDNLYSIANYFGHSLAVIYDWNPQYPDQRLRVGDPIRMPPPTR